MLLKISALSKLLDLAPRWLQTDVLSREEQIVGKTGPVYQRQNGLSFSLVPLLFIFAFFFAAVDKSASFNLEPGLFFIKHPQISLHLSTAAPLWKLMNFTVDSSCSFFKRPPW